MHHINNLPNRFTKLISSDNMFLIYYDNSINFDKLFPCPGFSNLSGNIFMHNGQRGQKKKNKHGLKVAKLPPIPHSPLFLNAKKVSPTFMVAFNDTEYG